MLLKVRRTCATNLSARRSLLSQPITLPVTDAAVGRHAAGIPPSAKGQPPGCRDLRASRELRRLRRANTASVGA